MASLGLRTGISCQGRSSWHPSSSQPTHPRYAGECSTSYARSAPGRRPGRGSSRSSIRCRAAGPWTKDDLEKLNQEVEQEKEAQLGEAWKEKFRGNVKSLESYTEDQTMAWCDVMTEMAKLPRTEWEANGAYEIANRMPMAMANELIGMGTWRLKGDVDPAIEYLVGRLEGCWREICVDDITLYPPSQWKGKYDICDSMDPRNELDGWSYADVPHPEKGQEGYPRLILENRLYASRVFRKLHLEVGWRQDGLQVLHAVLYPRYAYDMPILAMDLVVAGGVVTLAIIDACPVRKNKYLPPHYVQTMRELQDTFLTDAANARTIPDWGDKIFSPACVCIRPTSAADVAGFLKYAVALHRAHMMLSTLLEPIKPTDVRNRARLAEIQEQHKSFVDNQLANKKTSRVLEVAFGPEWTQDYMTRIMFDYAPGSEPPVVVDELTPLYEYFDVHPELGGQEEEVLELLDEVALSRAEEFLDALAAGTNVRQDKVEWALQTLYERDPDFRANVELLLPGVATASGRKNGVGAYLAGHLAALGLRAQEGWVKDV